MEVTFQAVLSEWKYTELQPRKNAKQNSLKLRYQLESFRIQRRKSRSVARLVQRHQSLAGRKQFANAVDRGQRAPDTEIRALPFCFEVELRTTYANLIHFTYPTAFVVFFWHVTQRAFFLSSLELCIFLYNVRMFNICIGPYSRNAAESYFSLQTLKNKVYKGKLAWVDYKGKRNFIRYSQNNNAYTNCQFFFPYKMTSQWHSYGETEDCFIKKSLIVMG